MAEDPQIIEPAYPVTAPHYPYAVVAALGDTDVGVISCCQKHRVDSDHERGG
jgi:hypothetical protein